MKTRLPFSTISYNTRQYLEGRLNDLVKARVLSEWYAILHHPEDDEAGTKEHFHVYLVPAKAVQTDDIRSALIEYDPDHPDKPKKCLSCHSSKFGHWYMYALHDRAYLASKNQSRVYQYRHEDMFGSDLDILHEHVKEIDIVGELGAFKLMESAIEMGLTFEQFFAQGRVPVNQCYAYEKAWSLLISNRTNRSDRQSHDIDEDTGEVHPEQT